MIQQPEKQKYRHEYKYICDAAESAMLKVRASGILKQDSHSAGTGFYRVRSLYFDDLEDSCYYENESGIGIRDKYRVRIYNAQKNRITLERKSKTNGMTLKVSAPIEEELCRQLMTGKIPQHSASFSLQLNLLLNDMREKCMRPAVIVDYIRYPFIEQSGNVRVTFDECIGSSNDFCKFLETGINIRPVMELGKSIMEVKWDEFLPDYIKKHLEPDSLQWTSFSKYYLCRKFNAYGGVRI